MSDHRAPRENGRSSVPLRALLSLGIVLGVGATGTLAYFTDDATMTTGAFTTGKLDLTLDQGTSSTTVGQGGTLAKTALGITAMTPGESVAADVVVKNNAGVPFTYKASGKLDAGSTFPTAAPVKLTFVVYAGSASNTGTAAASNRTGACTGTLVAGATTLTTTAQDVISTARTLASDASESICVRVGLATDADNTYQDKTATASFVFRAAQLGQTP